MTMSERNSAPRPRTLLSKRIVGGMIAAGLLFGSLAPAVALPGADSFRHHFHRNAPHHGKTLDHQARNTIGDQERLQRVSDRHAACSARFQSYNPGTGTYLGYDGSIAPARNRIMPSASWPGVPRPKTPDPRLSEPAPDRHTTAGPPASRAPHA